MHNSKNVNTLLKSDNNLFMMIGIVIIHVFIVINNRLKTSEIYILELIMRTAAKHVDLLL